MTTSTIPAELPVQVKPTAAPAIGTLGLGLLVALVVGSTIGSGIFGLPQNMAAGAILIGWMITGVGMLMLALVYQMLALRKPELDNGVYAYARSLSGEYVGFNSAWGYWISAWIGNVGYLVAAFGALGYFFPIFGNGNTPGAFIGASVVVWTVHLLVLRGIHGATVVNAVVTIAKVLPLVLFIASDPPIRTLDVPTKCLGRYDVLQFEEKLRQSQAREAETMQPKQKELDHVIALLKETEKEADEIARATRKVKGLVGERLQRQADEVDRRYQALTRRKSELQDSISGELTENTINNLLQFREAVALGLENPTFDDRRRWLEILQTRVTVTNGKAVITCRLGGRPIEYNLLKQELQ